MPGKKYRSIKGGKSGRKQYNALKRKGFSKSRAAAITNATQRKRRKKRKR